MAETAEIPNATEDATKSEDDRLAAEWAAMEEGDAAKSEDGAADIGSNRVLDQEEIDSLLGFEGDKDAKGNRGIAAMLNSALVSYERLPMLEIVYDRLVRLLSTSLRNFTSDNVEVSIDNIVSVRFGDYLNQIPLPAMLAVFEAREWENYGLIFIESSLIYSVVDVLLGGRRGGASMRVEGRPYTTIERNLIERMMGVVLADLKTAFDPIAPVRFRYDRLETNPRFATIARPANAAIVARFRIDMEDRGGKMELLFPYATLEPIRNVLLQMFMGEKFGQDSIWESHLATELWNTDIDIDVVLDEQMMKLSDVMNLRVGSFINLGARPDSEVELRCGDQRLFAGRMGRRGEKIAVCVERKIDRNKDGS